MKIKNHFSYMEINNRDLVQDFHKAFELLISVHPYSNIFVEKPNIVKLRYDLIHEEFKELLVAIETNNLVEVIDALMDILYVIYGAQISYGVSSSLVNFESYTLMIEDYSLHKLRDQVNKPGLQKVVETFKISLENFKTANNMDQVENLLNELLINTYYMCYVQGFDVDYCFMLVHKSNMSKLCANEEIAIRTVDWYKKNHLKTYDSPSYKYNRELDLWIVFNQSSGKVLKSIEYHPVSFTEYLETMK